MGSAMSMCGQKVSPVTNVGCEKAPGHDGPHGVLFGASPVTSPRTPRQLLGWTVPDHIESGTIGRWVNVTCRHGACHGTPESSRTYYVPAMSVAAAPAPFATFLRNHAHGGEATHTLAPLSEVLPETPEPPREDDHLTTGELIAAPLAHRCSGCGGTNTTYQSFSGGREYYCEDCEDVFPYAEGDAPRRVQMLADGRHEELRAEMGGNFHGPVPASQSVPAVPVSSTGGKETGEAAETATEALRVELTRVIDAQLQAALASPDTLVFSPVTAQAAIEYFVRAGWRPPQAAVGECTNCQHGEAHHENSGCYGVCGNYTPAGPLPDSETDPDNWESGAYIEPGIGGVANISTSGWPGGVNRVWLNVTSYSDKNRGADIVLEPDEADEIAAVLRGAAQSVRRDPGVTS